MIFVSIRSLSDLNYLPGRQVSGSQREHVEEQLLHGMRGRGIQKAKEELACLITESEEDNDATTG